MPAATLKPAKCTETLSRGRWKAEHGSFRSSSRSDRLMRCWLPLCRHATGHPAASKSDQQYSSAGLHVRTLTAAGRSRMRRRSCIAVSVGGFVGCVAMVAWLSFPVMRKRQTRLPGRMDCALAFVGISGQVEKAGGFAMRSRDENVSGPWTLGLRTRYSHG